MGVACRVYPDTWTLFLSRRLARVGGVSTTLAQHECGERQNQHHPAEHADLHDRARKIGPLVQQRGGLDRQHHDLLDAGQDPDDEERLRDNLVRAQHDRTA